MDIMIREKAFDMGALKIGIGNLEGYLPKEFSHLRTGISIVVRLSDQVLNDVSHGPTHTYYHHYRSVNFLIDQITLALTNLIQNQGNLAMAVPASQTVKTPEDIYTGIFQHKTAATLSGIGWIGKNACLITEEFGPRVRLGTVLTDMILPYDQPTKESKCGSCNICVKECPALAIKGVNWTQETLRDDLIDPFACSNHMSENYRDIGRGSVCGICISKCPRGEKVIR